MKISEISVFIVRVPLLHEWMASEEFGQHSIGKSEITLLRLSDGEGAEGWGEMAGNQIPALKQIAPSLLAMDLARIRLCQLDLWQPQELYWSRPAAPSPYAPNAANVRHRLRHPLQSLIEQAITDLMAHRLGVPVSHFFGGAWRDAVPTDYWAGRMTPEFAVKCARRGKQLGFCGIKLKTTLEDPNVERLEAIRDAMGPDFHVTVDPNGRFYRLGDAWKTISAMDRVGNMGILEDPFPRFYLDEFAALRHRIEARLVLHLDPVETFWSVIHSDGVDGLNMDSNIIGPFQWRLLAGAAEQANLPLWHGGGHDLGIGTAWHLHLAASTPNCLLPGDQCGPWFREHTLVKAPFQVENGHVRVPQGPGIGVEVDNDALDKYTVEKTDFSI